jgi:glutamate synthase domain-containing protein 3
MCNIMGVFLKTLLLHIDYVDSVVMISTLRKYDTFYKEFLLGIPRKHNKFYKDTKLLYLFKNNVTGVSLGKYDIFY